MLVLNTLSKEKTEQGLLENTNLLNKLITKLLYNANFADCFLLHRHRPKRKIITEIFKRMLVKFCWYLIPTVAFSDCLAAEALSDKSMMRNY